jgi:trimeric autotransporter adhesin
MNALRRALFVVGSAVALLLTGAPAHAVEYSTVPDPATSWKPNGKVYDTLTVGDRVYIAGDFTSLRSLTTTRSVSRDGLAAIDRTTGAVLDWNPGADGTVRALASGDNGVIYAGGVFTTAGGAPNGRVAALDADGVSVPTFSTSVNGDVRDLVVDGGSLYLSGAFGTVNGSPRRSVAKVDAATGEVDRAFNARVASGRVNALTMEGGRLLIGGSFDTLAGSPAQFLAALSPDTGASFGTAFPVACDTCTIYDLDTNVEGTGTFVYAAVGGNGGRVVKWSLSSGQRQWVRSGDGDVQAIDVFDQTVYAAGHFGPVFNGQTRHQLAVLTTGGALLPMSVPFTGLDKPGLWAVEADERGLLLGGHFPGIDGSAAARFAILPAR